MYRCLVNRGTMRVNSLPKTVTRQRRDCDLNPGRSAPESSTLTTRLPSRATMPEVYSCSVVRCVCARGSVDVHDHGMADRVGDGLRASLDRTTSPMAATFYTGPTSGGVDTLPTGQHAAATAGARRGSFLFRCESDDRGGDQGPGSGGGGGGGGMVFSASAARLSSLVQTNQLHEVCVSLYYTPRAGFKGGQTR